MKRIAIFIALKNSNKYLVVIVGPTAVGKTDLAIEIAKTYATVVVSADSRQIYAEMSIGTAKPAERQLKEVPHYFIGNKSVEDLYGAGHFSEEARVLLHELFKKHTVVVMAGGSGLYIDALLNGVDDFEEVPILIRERLNAEFAEKGLEWLQEQVKQKDPVYFSKADVSNPQRLIRALEIIEHSGKPFSEFRKGAKVENEFTAIKILVNTSREQLYQRINQRVDMMMDQGLLEEAKALAAKREANALKTVGYRELYEYLDGSCSLAQAVDKIKQHTRNYAKRQLTWFKNKDNFKEFYIEERGPIFDYIAEEISSSSN